MRSKTALVIVDVQPQFIPRDNRGCFQPSFWNIVKLYQAAIRDCIPTIILEYADYGNTAYQLLRLKNPRRSIQTKYTDDGAVELFEGCDELSINPQRFVFCGYNYGACVLRTIRAMKPIKKGEIIVVKDATNYDKWHHDRDYKLMPHVKHHCMFPASRKTRVIA